MSKEDLIERIHKFAGISTISRKSTQLNVFYGGNVAYIASLLIGLFCITTAYAWKPNDVATVSGAGMVSCGDYVKDRREGKKSNVLQYEQWIQGYLTAVSMYYPYANNKDFFKSSSIEGYMLYLENYCVNNPLVNFFQASQDLQAELLPVKAKQRK